MDEFETGPILSLPEVAERLRIEIKNKNNEGAQAILNSFIDENDATDVVHFLSEKDYQKLIELQNKANETIKTNETVKTNEIDEYVSISDRIARRLLCGARALDQGITTVFKTMNTAQNFCQETYKNISNTISDTSNKLKENATEMLQTTANTYEHTRWFLEAVLTKNTDKVDIIRHIRNKYGHLLFTYNAATKEFDINDSLTSILMEEYKKECKQFHLGRTATVSNDHLDRNTNRLANKRFEEIQKIQRTQSDSASNIKTPKCDDLVTVDLLSTIIETNYEEIENMGKKEGEGEEKSSDLRLTKGKSFTKKRPRDEEEESGNLNTKRRKVLIPRILILKRMMEQQKEKEEKEEKEGGKPRRKTRRKIRRNKKANTKKRKVNKKTKKRKTNKKTKINRKKSKKRRTKK